MKRTARRQKGERPNLLWGALPVRREKTENNRKQLEKIGREKNNWVIGLRE
jgi:hypothetical protein